MAMLHAFRPSHLHQAGHAGIFGSQEHFDRRHSAIFPNSFSQPSQARTRSPMKQGLTSGHMHSGAHGPVVADVNIVSFGPRSGRAPRPPFKESGPAATGGGGGGSTAWSSGSASRLEEAHELQPAELARLDKASGSMPSLAQVLAPVAPEKVEERVVMLEEKLRARIQGICDRFQDRNAQRKSFARKCRCVDAIRRRFRPGVLSQADLSRSRLFSGIASSLSWPCAHVWCEVLFFLVYTLCLQWYCERCEWDFKWSAAYQDTAYYPALVMSFLLSFRVSDCMARYQIGCRCVFQMEKHLREIAFQVLTKLSTKESGETPRGVGDVNLGLGAMQTANSDANGTAGNTPCGPTCSPALLQRYFKHEFRRLLQVLFAVAARDLNHSANIGEVEESETEPSQGDTPRLGCSLTDVENAALHVTHTQCGHVFKIYLATSWLNNLVRTADDLDFFEDTTIVEDIAQRLGDFKSAWVKARNVAYSQMPDSITHLLWILAIAMNFVLPWEYVSVCKRMTWLPSLFISVSFFGIIHIARELENPFGIDDDDIPMWQVAEHLDEEVSLIMFYAALDEVAGENLYRGLASQDHIYMS